ncbi:hypothetical protein [Butyrivibrio sp. INlla16]|nr:hypothetical protein [Butyrivibrio sp. INlla16]
MTIGKVIRKYRKENGLTQEEMPTCFWKKTRMRIVGRALMR